MISVVIPVYNVENYIVECLKSFTKQSCDDFELVLVNDGSRDNSSEKAKEYLNTTSLKWRVIDKENGGVSNARNTGLKECDGDYVVFVDADDVVSPDFLSELIQPLKEGDYDFSFCNYQFVKTQVPPSDTNDKTIEFDRKSILVSFLRRSIDFLVPSMMFKKSFLLENSLFYNEKIHFSEDQLFIWDAILCSEKSVYLYRKMYGYYIRENSTMTGSSKEKMLQGYAEYKKHIEQLVSKYPEYASLTDMILPRWCLGTLYTASDLLDYESFKDVYAALNGRSILREIIGIKEIKSYLLAVVSMVSPRLLYKLSRRMHE